MEIRICTENMIEFYSQFDYIDFKYELDKNSSSYLVDYRRLAEQEENNNQSEITAKNYGKMLANIDLIYDNAKLSEEFTKIYDLFYNKIICKYLNIEGLERLFNEKYMEFEWNMHLGIDYKGHKRNYYRDHFIHQIRNAYMMHILLNDFRFYQYVDWALQDGSGVANYVQKSIRLQTSARGSYSADFYMRNIIYMASYIGALFHDIAYPECSNMQVQKRINEFMPSLYNIEISELNWNKTYAVLQNSLLFKIVDNNKIHNKVMAEKPDHGALSAIIFLLNFYENSAIYHMEPYKKCALELGALAMYTHTDTYGSNMNAASARISFRMNPISYLLRICDDLQEWDRIYFEIISQSRCVICSKCKTPLIMKRRNGRKEYICNCCAGNANDDSMRSTFMSLFQNEADFSYRRVYNVTVCDALKISEEDPTGRRKIIFDLEYNLFKLLHIALLSNTYAAYRIKELNKVKQLLEFQGELPHMYIKYNMTSNPILIKVLMLERFFDCENYEIKDVKTKKRNFSDLQEISEEVWTEIENQSNISELADKGYFILSSKLKEVERESISPLKILLENKIDEVYAGVEKKLVKNIKKNISYYLELYFWMMIIKNLNQNEKDKEIIKDFCSGLGKLYTKNFYSKDLIEIIKDCFKQFGKMYLKIEETDILPDEYYTVFEASDYTYGSIQRYILPDNNWPIKMLKTYAAKDIDCYTDLYFFSYLEAKYQEYNNNSVVSRRLTP